LTAAQQADTLAEQAGQLANSDVDEWSRPQFGRDGVSVGGLGGAVLGGILLDGMLGGGRGGGFGGGRRGGGGGHSGDGGFSGGGFGWGGRIPGSFGGPGTRVRVRF
jgi:hypothetical protein